MADPQRIARLVGKTTYKDFRDGFGSATGLSLDSLTDADIAAAMAGARRRLKNGMPDPLDISDKIMLAYYASSRTWEDEIVKFCVRSDGEEMHNSTIRDLRDSRDRKKQLRAQYLERRGPAVKEWITPKINEEDVHAMIICRVAANIAANRLSGASVFADKQWEQMAWFCATSAAALRDKATEYECKLMDVIYAATRSFENQLAEKAA